MAAYILILVGALNWGLVGLGGFIKMNLNLVNLLLGQWPMVEWIVYLLVGIAAIYKIILCATGKCCSCSTDKK